MIIHSQDLSKEYLDSMWEAIVSKIPSNQWVEITKDYDKAVAAIKHFIDVRCYNEQFCLSFSNDFKLFRKVEFKKPVDLQELRKKRINEMYANND